MSEKYLLSYSAAAIRRADCVTAARAFVDCNDWKEVRRRVVEDDLLMIKAESSRKRISAEVLRRLKNLNEDELKALVQITDSKAQMALCWVAICRSYSFIAQFVTLCMAERWNTGAKTITIGLYESFYENEAQTHPELTTVKEATQKKLRSQLFTMLREIEFINKEGQMLRFIMPSNCMDIITDEDLKYFPTTN